MKNVIASLVALFGVGMLQAQEPPRPPGAPTSFSDDDDRTPPRLRFTDGEVSFWRPGAEDWTRAQINLPLAPGDALYAGDNANLELEIGPRSFIRAGEHTQIGLLNQEPDFLQLKVTSGHLGVDVRELRPGHTIEVGTPNAVFTVERTGYYRVDVIDDTSTFIARRGGSAFITPAEGEVHPLGENEQVVITGIDRPTSQSYAAADLDAWDRWNYDRSDDGGEVRSARYVPQGVYGVRDLDDHGDWEETSEYGHVWAPRHVAADWAPYSDGRWVWDAYYGWTWVDDAPWGWAPSHYGRWVHVRSRWCWAPGPVIAAPVYAPAVVAFFGSRHVSVSVGITAPAVGWVALGWGEPVIPWWGGRGYHGRPSWRGWGGPRVINRTVINKTTIVNVNNINIYENARVRNAVIVEREDRFGRRGDYRHARLREGDLERLRPVRGDLRVRPVSESLSPRRERGIRPSERVLERSVVATRQPRDTRQRLRAQGIQVRDQRPMTAPRIVESRRPDRERGQQVGQRDQEQQRDPRSRQQDVRRESQRTETDRAGRMERMRSQPQEQPNQREQNRRDRGERATRPAPAAPRSSERDAIGSSAGSDDRQRPSGRQERVRRPAEPRQQEQLREVRPQRPPQQREQRVSEPRQRERARAEAQPRREQPNRVERAERQREQRQQAPAVRAEPQYTRPQREAQPRREQPNRAERAERQREQRQQAPAVRAQPQYTRPQREAQPRREQPNRAERAERQREQRQQAPAMRARPESAPRQPEVRDARPRREAPQPERAERQQRPSAGDAPRRQERRRAPENGRSAPDSGASNDRHR